MLVLKKLPNNERSNAEHELDILFLKFLEKEIDPVCKPKIIVVDVHFNTINQKGLRSSYIPLLRSLSQKSNDKLVLNIRRIPSDVNVKVFKEQLKPLANSIKTFTAQLAPHEFKSFIKSPLPVSGLICSYLSTQFNDFDVTLLKKVKAALPNANIPMIVRGIPSDKEITYLAKLGFTGFGISVP